MNDQMIRDMNQKFLDNENEYLSKFAHLVPKGFVPVMPLVIMAFDDAMERGDVTSKLPPTGPRGGTSLWSRISMIRKVSGIHIHSVNFAYRRDAEFIHESDACEYLMNMVKNLH